MLALMWGTKAEMDVLVAVLRDGDDHVALGVVVAAVTQTRGVPGELRVLSVRRNIMGANKVLTLPLWWTMRLSTSDASAMGAPKETARKAKKETRKRIARVMAIVVAGVMYEVQKIESRLIERMICENRANSRW